MKCSSKLVNYNFKTISMTFFYILNRKLVFKIKEILYKMFNSSKLSFGLFCFTLIFISTHESIIGDDLLLKQNNRISRSIPDFKFFSIFK